MKKKPKLSSNSIYIALGSSVGNGPEILGKAATYLEKEGIKIVKKSQNHTFPPFGGVAENDFTNAVWEISPPRRGRSESENSDSQRGSHKEALELLEICQKCEKALGRDRSKEKRWGDRPLDIDILWFKGESIKTDTLTIPHPEMWNRDFVMIPLKEIL